MPPYVKAGEFTLADKLLERRFGHLKETRQLIDAKNRGFNHYRSNRLAFNLPLESL